MPNKNRDPNAPKRNQSAYLLYQNAMRESFKQQNPGMTFGQLSKYTSAMYAEMPPEEKEHWVSRAEADKARYLHELSQYVPGPGFDAKGDLVVSEPKVGRKGKIKTRDPRAPKKNMSAYLLYQNAMRDQFKLENPGMTFGQLAKYTSHMYRSLTTEEKAHWEQRSAEDKNRYDGEMMHYSPPNGYDSNGQLLEEVQKKLIGKKKKVKDPNAPKRARGSYVYFTEDCRPQILRENPTIKFIDLGTAMGQKWRALSAEEKRKYEDKAAEDKERFAQEMAAYKEQKEAALQAHAQQQNAAQQAALAAEQAQAQHEQYVEEYGSTDPHAAYMHVHDPQAEHHYYEEAHT